MKRPASSTPVDLTESKDNNKEKRKEPAKVAKTSDDKASKKEKGQQSCSYEPMCDMPSSLFDSLSCREEARRFKFCYLYLHLAFSYSHEHQKLIIRLWIDCI